MKDLFLTPQELLGVTLSACIGLPTVPRGLIVMAFGDDPVDGTSTACIEGAGVIGDGDIATAIKALEQKAKEIERHGTPVK